MVDHMLLGLIEIDDFLLVTESSVKFPRNLLLSRRPHQGQRGVLGLMRVLSGGHGVKLTLAADIVSEGARLSWNSGPFKWDYLPVPATEPTMVIEDGVIPRRVRRPIDLLRMVGALAAIAGILTFATVAVETVSGIDADVADSASKLPAFIALVLGLVSGFGQLLLPTGIAVSMLNSRRGRLLAEAISAFTVASILCVVVTSLARNSNSADFWFALAGSTNREIDPLQPLLAGIFAFVTVARLRGNTARISATILATTLIADLISGSFTVAAQAVSVLIGWSIGLAFRYAVGTPTVRPRGIEIANLLTSSGFPINVLRATRSTDRGRRYAAVTITGERIQVVVFDRDLEGAGVLPRWWRILRLRDEDALGGWSMRETVERASLMAFAGAEAHAPVPRLRLVKALGSDACVLAYDWVEGPTLETMVAEKTEISDAVLENAWQGLEQLHSQGIAHRGISLDHLVVDRSEKVWMVHITSGTVAMSDLQERIDTADMLFTLALATSPERSVAAARKVLGDKKVIRALAAMQPFAMNIENRRALRKNRDTLQKVREAIAATAPADAIDTVSIERLQPRKILSLVALVVAGYFLLGQLAKVNVIELFRTADYQWVFYAAIFTVLTFIGSAMALDGFVVEKLNHFRTFLAQFAASFATLVSPPALGTVAINGRYLQREGLSATAAGATVAVSQVIAFLIHILLLFVAGIAAGTSQDLSFSPPREAVIALGVVALILLIVLPLPQVRKFVFNRARPRLEEVIPRFVTVAQRPAKLAIGIGGMFLLNIAFCFVLVACVRAFGGGGTIAAISLVYLAGSTLGQAAPTPGGIGAVETVMTAGLVAAGVDGGVALSAVLLFRLLTFWLPTIPGWFSFQYLTKRGSL